MEEQEKQQLEEKLNELQKQLNNALANIEKLSQENLGLNNEKEALQEKIENLKEQIENTTSDIEQIDSEETKEQKENNESEENSTEEKTEETKTITCQKNLQSQPVQNLIIINEVAWMGTINSFSDEWIELKNISSNEINLEGWEISNENQTIKTAFNKEQTIKTNNLFLLERTDDDSANQVTADLIYNGAISNTNETLYLFDNNCQLRDKVSASSEWPAGDNSSKRTMERKQDLSWQTSNNIGGTPKQQNSSGYYVQYPSGGNTNISNLTVTTPPTTPTPTSTPGILITEVKLESSSSSNDEFIELYNYSLETINISNFQLKKKTSTGNEYSIIVFSENTYISSKEYFIWANSEANYCSGDMVDATTTQTLSKDNSIALFNKDKSIIDAIAWGSSTNPFVENSPFLENPNKQESLGRKWSENNQAYIDTNNNYNDFQIQKPTLKARNDTSTENQTPIALFSFENRNYYIGEEILLSAASSTDPDGTINYFLWDFNNEVQLTTHISTTTYSFATSGDFIISLKVVDNLKATSSEATSTVIVQNSSDSFVIINEIAWMGTASSSILRNDEWIELYNTTSSAIDLTDWSIVFDNETKIIISSSTASTTTIPSQGFYLIERTDDEAVKDIPADWIGPFGHGLSNEGERIELRNAKNELVDLVDCNSGWFFGEASPGYITMERINSNDSGNNPENWGPNNLIKRNGINAEGGKINGTPKSRNSLSFSETIISSTNTLPFLDFDEITLSLKSSPYFIYDIPLYIPHNKILNIEPGVTLKFNRNKIIDVDGTIRAIGKENEEIVMTKASDNDWAGIIFKSDFPQDQAMSHFDFVMIEGAKRCWNINCNEKIIISSYGSPISFKNLSLANTSDITKGVWLENSTSSFEKVSLEGFRIALEINGGNSQIENCSFSKNTNGLYITNNAILNVKNNYFSSNENPIYLFSSQPFFEGNYVENNDLNGVVVSGTNTTTTLSADLVYVFNPGNVGKDGVFIINPGVIIKFNQKQTTVNGKIIAVGDSQKPIVFTSMKDDQNGGDTNNDAGNTLAEPGDWTHLYFTASSSVLDNVNIKYGGSLSSPLSGAIKLGEEVDIIIKDSVVENNVYALYFLNLTDCQKINERIDVFVMQGTIFRDNQFLSYPKCP